MPGFSGIDDLVSEVTANGKLDTWDFYKYPTSLTTTNGAWFSLWTCSGNPGAGATPATTPGTSYTNGAGGIEFPDRSTDLRFLTALYAALSTGGTLMAYDRLVAVSGISLTSTGDKTISSASLPRYTDGVGVQAWVELTAASSVTNPTLSMNSYTNENNTGSRAGSTRQFVTASNTAGTMYRLNLQAGDHGVRAISTINVATATTGATCNVVLLRPIGFLSTTSATFNARDFVLSYQQYNRIYDGATIALAYLSSSNAISLSVWGALRAAYG